MKTIISLIGCLLLFSTLSYSQINRAFPSVQLKKLNGESISTDDIKNNKNPILIIVWATWCHHSTDGMSLISEEYFDEWENSYNLKVVGISVDDARNIPKVSPAIYGNGWDLFEHYLDPNADFKRAMGINQPPHLFILNKDRKVVWSFNSFNPGDEGEIENILETLNSK